MHVIASYLSPLTCLLRPTSRWSVHKGRKGRWSKEIKGGKEMEGEGEGKALTVVCLITQELARLRVARAARSCANTARRGRSMRAAVRVACKLPLSPRVPLPSCSSFHALPRASWIVHNRAAFSPTLLRLYSAGTYHTTQHPLRFNTILSFTHITCYITPTPHLLSCVTGITP